MFSKGKYNCFDGPRIGTYWHKYKQLLKLSVSKKKKKQFIVMYVYYVYLCHVVMKLSFMDDFVSYR